MLNGDIEFMEITASFLLLNVHRYMCFSCSYVFICALFNDAVRST